jgi:hypothetical protein
MRKMKYPSVSLASDKQRRLFLGGSDNARSFGGGRAGVTLSKAMAGCGSGFSVVGLPSLKC